MILQRRNRRSLLFARSVLILAFFGSLVLAVWWFPKSDIPYPDQPSMGLRWYRGFGLCDQPNILGKLYYRLDEVLTLPEDGLCHIDFRYGQEKHPFIAKYPDGRIRAKGLCKVIVDEYTGQPRGMDVTQVTDAEYYSPDGKTKKGSARGHWRGNALVPGRRQGMGSAPRKRKKDGTQNVVLQR